MSLTPLTLLKTRLSENAALAAYWQVQYGKQPKHWIGYKRAPSANDYPSLCYVPVKSRRDHKGNGLHLVSLVIGVHEQGMTDDIFHGVARLGEAEDLILAALVPLKLSDDYHIASEPVEIMTDLGARHPFYETELQILIHRGRYGKL